MDITGIRLVISEGNGGIMGIFDKAKSEAEDEVENQQQNMGQQGGMQDSQQGGMQTARDTIGRQGGGQGQGTRRHEFDPPDQPLKSHSQHWHHWFGDSPGIG
jgi:hypothetical protein